MHEQDIPTLFVTFDTLRQLNADFEADRPLMMAKDRPDLLFFQTQTGYSTRQTADSGTVSLAKPKLQLLGEIDELNRRSEYGYLAAEENYFDDQQQEMADVLMFALKCELYMKANPKSARLELSDRTIAKLTDEWLTDFHIKPVFSEEPLTPVKQLTAAELEKFEELKAEVNYYGRRLKAQPDDDLSRQDFLLMKVNLEYLVSAVFAMYHLLGVHPVRQAAEKVARNYLKYPAWMFGIQFVPQLDEDLPVSVRAEAYSAAFKRQMKKVPDLWDGPVPTDAEGNVLIDEAGQPLPRPGYGSDDFYGYHPEKITDDGEHEVRSIGGEQIIFDRSKTSF